MAKVWWQKKIEDLEAEVKRLSGPTASNVVAGDWKSKADYYKQLADEHRQRIAALEGKIARMDVSASHLLSTHEEMLSIIENFRKYAENYQRRNYGPQMVALAASARTAEQKFRRER